MLKSKHESSGGGEPLSVTILNIEQLPAYASERFYVLSELEQNGHSTVFLYEEEEEEEECDETQETEESSQTSTPEDQARGPATTTTTTTIPGGDVVLAPFLILYLLWRPEMDAREFVETILSKAIDRLETLTDIMPTKDERLPGSLNRSSSRLSLGASFSELGTTDASRNALGQRTTTIRNGESNGTGGGLDLKPSTSYSSQQQSSSSQATTPFGVKQPTVVSADDAAGSKLYLVVERVCPVLAGDSAAATSSAGSKSEDGSEEAKQRHYQVQVDLAEHLARMVASHPYLRTVCEGITVGVSNHVRAAPGLDACMDGVLVGAKDRRKYASNNDSKGCMGLVGCTSEDFLGLEQNSEADAVQGVLQCRVCAEWNGRGTLQTFARRAHQSWRVNHGLSPEEPRPHPFFQRKGSFGGGPTDSLELDAADLLSGLLAFCFWVAVAAYLWENRVEFLQRVFPREEKEL
jgi:hypothetical protein